MPPQLLSARRHQARSALLAKRAVTEAHKAAGRGERAVAVSVKTHQVAAAAQAQSAVAQMLAEQSIAQAAEAQLNTLAFTTDSSDMISMLDSTRQPDSDQGAFDRLVESLVQDAARAAESVAITARPNTYYVRSVNPPCCSRCALLAGRVYRWSTGFQRHPRCDCSMIATTVGSRFALNPADLLAAGQVTGLSKDDLRALDDGADLGRVVNVRNKSAGLLDAGHALTRAGKPTPAGIYRLAGDDRAKALGLLKTAGYIR